MTFEDWWKVYPKKVGKKLSKKIWDRDKLKADELIAKLEIQVKTCARYQNRQYIPDPATYLNQERWDDEIEVQRIEVKLPRNNDDLIAFAESHGIKTQRGESYPEFRQRIERELRK